MLIDLSTLSLLERQHWLQHAIAPRPICFAATIDSEGFVNLSPFSFYNLFSINPPVVVFSPSRRVRDNTTKHTLDNLVDVPEVTISVVDYEMVQQVSLSSCEFAKEDNEFIKAGFTIETSTLVRPPMVKEAKIKFECRVLEIKSLGTNGGAGQLVIAEILRMHVDERVLGADGKIDQRKISHVARLGGDWYCRVDESNLFLVAKPNTKLGIGVDALPEHIRNSTILTGNDLGQLANVYEQPAVLASYEDERVKSIFQYYSLTPDEMEVELHRYAKELLRQNRVDEAWQVLLTL
ncbi:flavin reductase family protein [Segetibacter sp. 3557_3]|uniref:flavin reductase family protein n=1 Tax=Segetibacter sp. 3557_3 TaxID=2547429 RepID=UPI001058E68D|nr:flavin reductase family protein [Segetibacter sp. 3557_3]TDH23220.1 flavin reductase family protein [Segetibacter sp. 3557_3]